MGKWIVPYGKDTIMNIFLILLGRTFSNIIQFLNLGNGSTWPGHIALKLNKNFISDLMRNSKIKIIFVVGTNGKTTTTSLIKHLLVKQGKSVIQNNSGANLLNGIASTLLLNASVTGKINADYALFEIDENAFPKSLHEIQPDVIVMLNLFRDQLDRYGEVASIAHKWHTSVNTLSSKTTLILNADDPQIAYLGENVKCEVSYFGYKADKSIASLEHAVDSTYCPRCGTKLTYKTIAYSHLGDWHCENCKLDKPQDVYTHSPVYPLSGIYNAYNTHAALLSLKLLGFKEDQLTTSLASFQPAFGRQEELNIQGKRIKIILAKNPTGFNESLRTITELKGQRVLLVLNDRVADGKDVSWIWDIDFEKYEHLFYSLIISGERSFDLGLRIKYTQKEPIPHFIVEPDLKKALDYALKDLKKDETLFILPTYTAMLQVREILTGKKIL